MGEVTKSGFITALHAPQAGLSRLSSSAPALDLNLHVSSRNQQQHRCCSQRHCQQQQPSTTIFTTTQARLGRLPRPGWLKIGCATIVCEALLFELRSILYRGRFGSCPRRAVWHHGTCLPTGMLAIYRPLLCHSFPLPTTLFRSFRHMSTAMMRTYHRGYLHS